MKLVIVIYNGLDAVAEIWIKTERQTVDKEGHHLLDEFVHSPIDKQSEKVKDAAVQQRVHKHRPSKTKLGF